MAHLREIAETCDGPEPGHPCPGSRLAVFEVVDRWNAVRARCCRDCSQRRLRWVERHERAENGPALSD